MNQWTVTFQPLTLTLNELQGKCKLNETKNHSQNIPNAVRAY